MPCFSKEGWSHEHLVRFLFLNGQIKHGGGCEVLRLMAWLPTAIWVSVCVSRSSSWGIRGSTALSDPSRAPHCWVTQLASAWLAVGGKWTCLACMFFGWRKMSSTYVEKPAVLEFSINYEWIQRSQVEHFQYNWVSHRASQTRVHGCVCIFKVSEWDLFTCWLT